ncbi:MAG TPA: FAD-dependent oxidoreductase [Solirubrobacterales bacterium]|nr:FAD-dependent oxidoreductase [Solirubrobacterales bacterium]
MNGTRHAVVVGGGPAGLMAAGRLAGGGFETLLLEGGPHLGGRAASETRGGFVLNQGPHALYIGGPAGRELKGSGIELDWWQPAAPAASVFPREGKAKRTLGGTGQLGRWFLKLQRTDPAELAGISAAEWLRRSLGSERARASAAALVRVTTFVADQESLSADVAATQLKIGLLPGVRYLRGGWQSLVDALAAKAEAEGATLRTRAAVRALERGTEGWEARLDGETLRADVVVLAAGGPDAAAKLLGERAPAAPGPAAELSVLDLGLRRLPRRSRRFALGVDKPTYLSRHSPPEHRDGVLLTLASYAREPRAALEELADAVQPGWREEATLERFLPRMVAVSAIPTPAGGGLPGRPAIDRGDGLYLAGDWVGGEGWLVDAALASGAAAAAAALRGRVPLAA